MADDNGGSKKRRRKQSNNVAGDHGGDEKSDLKGIITTLLLLDEQERCDQDDQDRASEEHKTLIDSNHKRKTRAMLDYYSNLQDFYSEIEGSDSIRRKRSRLAVDVAGDDEISSESEKVARASRPAPPPPEAGRSMARVVAEEGEILLEGASCNNFRF